MIQRTLLPALFLSLTLSSASVWANPSAIQEPSSNSLAQIEPCTFEVDVPTVSSWFPWFVERNELAIDIESNKQQRWIQDQNWIDLNPLMIRRVSGIG